MAIAIARRLGARVRVVRVESSNPLLDRLGLENYIRPRRGRLQPGLAVEEIADSAGFPTELLEIVNRDGRARTVLPEEASQWSADLVVIGPSSPESLPRMVLGSVTDNLVRSLQCPLMVVKSAGPFPPEGVLFPVDLSALSADALACGLSFLGQIQAEKGGLECEALLIVPETPVLATAGEAERVAEIARGELELWLGQVLDVPGRLTPRVRRGPVASTIVGAAAAGRTDLIVMGTHGHGAGPIQRQLVGSVVAPVLVDPPTNILLIPPPTQFGAELADAVYSQTVPAFVPPKHEGARTPTARPE